MGTQSQWAWCSKCQMISYYPGQSTSVCPAGGNHNGNGSFNYQLPFVGTAPSVVTDAATGVTSTGATLNGTVNPESDSTTYQFDYGLTTSYGTSVPSGGASAGSGSSAVAESATLTGLTSSTEYHYRIEATNSTGTSFGNDTTFTTSGSGGGGMSAPPGYTTKVFEDAFTGTTLDTTKWNTYLGASGQRWSNNGNLPSPWSGSNMPGANNVAIFNPSQVVVNNGLSLVAQPYSGQYASMGYSWISGCISTGGLWSTPQGSKWYIQVKAKMPDSSDGMWPAIWFLAGPSGSSLPEIDLFEGGFTGDGTVNQVIHSDWGGGSSQPGYTDNYTNTGVDLSADYHIYGMEFIAGTSLKFYFDGNLDWTYTGGGNVNGPYEIILELQVYTGESGGWHTAVNSNTPNPSTMSIAEVQVWTPLKDDNEIPGLLIPGADRPGAA